MRYFWQVCGGIDNSCFIYLDHGLANSIGLKREPIRSVKRVGVWKIFITTSQFKFLVLKLCEGVMGYTWVYRDVFALTGKLSALSYFAIHFFRRTNMTNTIIQRSIVVE